ncbi:MAG: LAGLIDADG family homing endonuclease [Candidatus Diapherotrites archaeon]
MAKLLDYYEELDSNVMIFGIAKILKESHMNSGLTCRQAADLLNISKGYYHRHLTTKPCCSIRVLKSFAKNIDSSIFSKVYALDNVEFTGKNKKVHLPKQLDPNLAYFIGYLQGAGCLTSDRKRVIFSDEYKEQLEKVNSISEYLFGLSGKIISVKSTLSKRFIPCLPLRSIVVNSFLHNIFGINRGVKENLRIPGLIKNDKSVLKYYLAGLFDSDGTLPKNPKKAKQLFIDLTFKDKKFIEEIKETLLNFGIETLKIYKRVAKSPSSDRISDTYELRIRNKEMLFKFLQNIDFYHPNKAIRSRKMIELLGG